MNPAWLMPTTNWDKSWRRKGNSRKQCTLSNKRSSLMPSIRSHTTPWQECTRRWAEQRMRGKRWTGLKSSKTKPLRRNRQFHNPISVYLKLARFSSDPFLRGLVLGNPSLGGGADLARNPRTDSVRGITDLLWSGAAEIAVHHHGGKRIPCPNRVSHGRRISRVFSCATRGVDEHAALGSSGEEKHLEPKVVQ